MTANTAHTARGHWRALAWGTAAALVALPLVAMQFTEEVNWTPADFAFAAAMIGGAGVAFELAVRVSANHSYRAGAALALAAAFLLVWINLAVGIIGSEDNPANLLYAGVLGVGLIGVLLARLRPQGMARAMLATAVAQIAVAVIAAVTGLAFTGPITMFFGSLWLTSAWLFRRAAA